MKETWRISVPSAASIEMPSCNSWRPGVDPSWSWAIRATSVEAATAFSVDMLIGSGGLVGLVKVGSTRIWAVAVNSGVRVVP